MHPDGLSTLIDLSKAKCLFVFRLFGDAEITITVKPATLKVDLHKNDRFSEIIITVKPATLKADPPQK